MSTFWTRARHVSSTCRCTLCRPSGPKAAASRRAGGTIRHQQQEQKTVGLPISMTLFYGTIMGAALYSDARVKLDKRRRLEAAIDQARTETQELDKNNQARMLKIGFQAIQEYCDQHGGKESSGNRPSNWTNVLVKRIGWLRHKTQKLISILPTLRDEEQLALTADQLAKLQKKLHHMLQRYHSGKIYTGEITPEKELKTVHQWQCMQERQAYKEKDKMDVRRHLLSPLLHELSGPEVERVAKSRSAEELWATEEPLFTFSEYWTRRQEVSLTLLIYQLLRYAISVHGTSFVQQQLNSDSVLRQIDISAIQSGQAINTMHEQVKILVGLHLDQQQSDDVKTTPLVRLGAAAHMTEDDLIQSRKTLNNALFDIFSSQPDGQQSLIVSVCQVLARVHVSPDTKMFNILLVNLLRLQHAPLVVDAWKGLHLCGLVCNETSVASVLKAWTSLGSESWFRRTAQQLDVLRGDGLITLSDKSWHLAELYPNNVSDEAWLGLMVLNRYRKFEATKTRFIRLPRNEDLFSALVIGFIELNDLESAGKEFSKYLASGLPLTLDLWNAMLLRVLQARDLEIGQSLSCWILNGKVQGSRASMTDAVYVMAEIAALHSSEERAQADMLAINAYAARYGLLKEPLIWVNAQKHKDRKDRDYDLMLQRMMLLRRINRSVLHLRFGGDDVQNISQDITDPAVDELPWQPRELYQYAAMRLRSLHERFELNHGPLPQTKHNEQLLDVVRKATMQVEFWCRSETKQKMKVPWRHPTTRESKHSDRQHSAKKTFETAISQSDDGTWLNQTPNTNQGARHRSQKRDSQASDGCLTVAEEVILPLDIPASPREVPQDNGEMIDPKTTDSTFRSSVQLTSPTKVYNPIAEREDDGSRRDTPSGSLHWVSTY